MSGVITALKVQQKNKDRVNVFIDGHFAFGLAAIEAVRLRVNQALSDDEITALQDRDEAQKAHESALRLLDRRPRSVDEIRRHLQGKKVDAAIIEQVIERLSSVGLLDDREFARYWLENRSDFRPRGQRALRQELRLKGISDDLVAEVLSEEHDEDDAAYRAALAQARKIKSADPREFRRKMEAHLARRGFSYESARDATAKAWQELHQEENDIFEDQD